MTLAEIIRAYEASRPVPALRTTCLTPLGAAYVAAMKLAEALADIPDLLTHVKFTNLVLGESMRLWQEARAKTA